MTANNPWTQGGELSQAVWEQRKQGGREAPAPRGHPPQTALCGTWGQREDELLRGQKLPPKNKQGARTRQKENLESKSREMPPRSLWWPLLSVSPSVGKSC